MYDNGALCVSALVGLVIFWPFDLETGVRVASNVGNLHFEFGHAGPSGSRVIRYVRDERTDGQKQRLMPPSLRAAA